MSSITTNLASKTLKRRLLPFIQKPITIISRSSSSETQTQKLERIADVLLDLTKIERHDYAILFRHKMGLGRYGPAVSGAILSGSAAPGSASGDLKTAAAAEKTAFDIKLEKFDAAAKIKVIKEVRTFTDLGLKEAKDLVEKVPVVLKKGLTKEEAGPIIEKLQALGATVVLE
ncbi:39S RIBOSOMAL PROTEIN L12 [Salix viminalis]|uniref:39S RIBOSOMAL PROTEIN L12 n=2 Tax=Salix TaxID=40685 RepID=A0A6N2K7J6_SALVM|nr:39S RIBOSOMAL PROTEIN L12 [Salix viminalis]